MEHLPIDGKFDDCRKSWFMQQHFTPEELQQLYEWEQAGGKIGKVTYDEEYKWRYYHILDTELKIDLCRMDEEEQLRRWMHRAGYKDSEGKISEWESENKK